MPWTWSKYDRSGLAKFVLPRAAELILPLVVNLAPAVDAESRKTLLGVIYDELAKKNITYSSELYTPDQAIQQIRTPEEILKIFGRGTCLDLSLLFAGICLSFELLPIIIILDGHAFVAVSFYHGLQDWDALTRPEYDEFAKGPIDDVRIVRALLEDNRYLPVECTGFTTSKGQIGNLPERTDLTFEEAITVARGNLSLLERPFLYGLDPAIARYLWKIPEAETPATAYALPIEYTERFIHQFENWHSRSREVPITDAMFRANLKTTYVPVGYIDSTGAYHESLESFLESWCKQSRGRYLSVLGDYGTGKTSTMLHLTYLLLCECRRTFYRTPLPVYLTFRDLNGPHPPIEQFCHVLKDRYGIPISSITEFEAFAHTYRVILILDGLDEITASLDSDLIKRCLNDISPILIVCEKIILSCRTTFFPSRTDLEHVLPMQAAEISLLENYLPDCTFEVVIVTDLDASKQEVYLTKVCKDPGEAHRLHTLIQSTYSLAQLSRRPILLSMIEKSLALTESQNTSDLSPASLYDRYIDAYLNREFLEKHSSLRVSEKRAILRELAALLYREGKTSMTRKDLITFLRDRPRDENWRVISLDELEYDFVACSFLSLTADGVFGFSHRSFLEFFVAESLLNDIQAGRNSTLSTFSISPVIMKFLSDLSMSRQATREVCATLEQWLDDALVASNSQPYKKNIVAALCRIGYSFAERILTGIDCSYTDLASGNFHRCNLVDADLSGSNLSDADFSEALLSRSSLRNAFLNRTSFQRANLQDADLWNIRMVDGPTSVLAAGFIPHSDLIAIGTSVGDFIVCSVTNTSVAVLQQTRIAPTGILHFAFSPDGKTLALSDRAARVYLFQTEYLHGGGNQPSAVIGEQTDNVRWLEFSPSGTQLACGARDSLIRIWIFGGRNELIELQVHSGPVMCVRWSPLGNQLASGGYDGMTYVFSLDSNSTPVALRRDSSSPTHDGIVRAVAFNQDGTMLSTAGEDGFIRIWARSAANVFHFVREIDIGIPVFALSFLSNGTLALGTSDGQIGIADTSVGSLVKIIRGHDDIVRSIEARETLILTASWDGTTRLWTLNDLELVADVYEVAQVDHRDNDSFAGAQIGGVKGLSRNWLNYFVQLGASSGEMSPIKVENSLNKP